MKFIKWESKIDKQKQANKLKSIHIEKRLRDMGVEVGEMDEKG